MATLENTMAFLDRSPSPFHAVAAAADLLNQAGFTRLEEGSAWTLAPGGQYYVTRNQSSLIAFRLPSETLTAWRMTAAHSDVPTFAVKGDRLDGDAKYARLSAEGGEQAVRPLFNDDALDGIDGERLEINFIRERLVRHDGRRVGVAQHDVYARVLQNAARLRARIVKFGSLPDDDGSRPDDEYLFDITSLRHISSPFSCSR